MAVFGCVLIGAGALLGACGTEELVYGTTVSTGGEPLVLTIEQALVAKPGQAIKVQGAIVAIGTGADAQVVLASVLLESYPPQAGGATLPVRGLDLESLVGLSSTADHPELAQVTWSDYWLTLEGSMVDGVLTVWKPPRVVEATGSGMRVRFSPVSDPLVTGGNVWWAFDIKNIEAMPLDLVFSSGQKAEVILAQSGVEKYRWSADKAFTEAIEAVAMEPGRVYSFVLNDTMRVVPGEYEVTAKVAASVGPAGGPASPGSGIPLPEIKTTVTVK
jgi:hypothetical protein